MNVDWAEAVNDVGATDFLRAIIAEIEKLEADGIEVPALVVGGLRVDSDSDENMELWRMGSPAQCASVARYMDATMYRRVVGLPTIGQEGDIE